MNNQRLSFFLKVIIAIMALLGLFVYGIAVPNALAAFTDSYPEFGYFYLPWLLLILITAFPLFAILGFGFSISLEMKKNMLFTTKNAKSLRYAALCLGGDALFFFAGNITYWLLNLNHPGVVIGVFVMCVFIVLIAAAVGILADMVDKAAVIREENESFI